MWVKTPAGRAEMQTRAQVQDRAQRNLLLLIDGGKSDEVLLGSVSGVTAADLASLQALGLIEQSAAPAPRAAPAPAAKPAAVPTAPAPLAPAAPTSYGDLSQALTQLIANELGLRGLPLTLAVERASTLDELQEVARRAIEQVAKRHGAAAAHKAQQALLGA